MTLISAGDQLQSAASRMAEWIRGEILDAEYGGKTPEVPYEVRMAALEAQSASEEWAEARKSGWKKTPDIGL